MSDLKDVFISYAHIDDQSLNEGQSGWVTEFHRHLETRLNMLWGQRSKVWRDPSLQGNDLFARTIEEQFQQVRTMLSILTPRYVKSDWCRREMLGFQRAAEKQGGFQVGDKARLFKILKSPLTERDLPSDFPRELRELFRNLLGYEFYDVDPQSKRPREYSREFGPQAEQLYHAKVYDVAWELCELLKQLEATPASGTAGHVGKTIYLAVGTSDLQSERDRIKRELLERGHTVLPDYGLPLVANEVRQAVRSALEQCDLVVQLIGGFYGFVPEGATESIVQIQNALAAEVAKAKELTRLIWMPADLQPAEDRQGEFVRRLNEDEATQRDAEVLKGPIDLLKDVLLERLKPPPEESERLSPKSEGKAPLVYLIGDRADQEAMDAVDDYLYEGGLEVTRPFFEGDEAEMAEAHKRRLVECDAALIYYGSTSRDWVDMKLMDLDQARGYGREKEYRARGVCVAPPEDRGKQRFRSRAIDVLRLGESLRPEVLSPFLERVSVHN